MVIPMTLLLIDIRAMGSCRVFGYSSGRCLLVPRLHGRLPAEIIVTREQLLHFLFPQQQQVFLFVLILAGLGDLIAVVFAAEDVLGHKSRPYIFLQQLSPGKPLKPRVLLDFRYSEFSAQAVAGLPLNHLSQMEKLHD